MTGERTGDHVAANRATWDADADNWVERGRCSGRPTRSRGASGASRKTSSGSCRTLTVRTAWAARILRPGGLLMFLGHSYLAMLTFPDDDQPATDRLQRDHFGMHRFGWREDDVAVEFAITHGDMVRLLRRSGFVIEDLVEVRAPEGAEAPADPLATPEWSRRWPVEEAWKARKAG
jgi:hypothetical protein